jgi:tRNA dimethylallyltransferase
MLVILGPTASGKTALAAQLAFELDGEIISADSRQVYRGMDIGTGKDLDDLIVNGHRIPVHLTDIADPGYEYNIFEYQQDFLQAYRDIEEKGKMPILCGGSGMYLEAVLRQYDLAPVNPDPGLASALETKSDEELREMLRTMRPLHNTTDLTDRNRTIRAILATVALQKTGNTAPGWPDLRPVIIGIRFERQVLRQRITARLDARLKHGMIEEVERLLQKGITPGQLKFYGLEYRFVTRFLEKEIDYQEMFNLLNTAIHQFAKRQMTWFRRMEKSGILIHWLDGVLSTEEKSKQIKEIISGMPRKKPIPDN